MTKANDVEGQFVRQFAAADWTLFKKMADAHISEAAFLKRSDMRRSGVNTLLARNVRKRLLIGLGAELLLKSAYLKADYAINLPNKGSKLRFPFAFDAVGGEQLTASTATFAQCLAHVHVVVALNDAVATKTGLEIAKVFRNKEAHSVAEAHAFDPETYSLIESSLRRFYEAAFGETLRVKIAMARSDKAVWKLTGATEDE